MDHYRPHNNNNNRSLHIATPNRSESVSGISTTSSYSSSNGSNGFYNNNYSSPINSPTLTGRPPYTFTTSDRGGRITSPSSPLPLPPPPPFQSSTTMPISFTPNYNNHGLPSPPMHTQLTASSSNNLSPPAPTTLYTIPGDASVSSYGYTSSTFGVDVRNSYAEYCGSSLGSHEKNATSHRTTMQPRLSESSSTSTTPSSGSSSGISKRETLIFPPSEEEVVAAENELAACKSMFRVIYAGDVSFRETGALYNRTKRAHFVLTNNLLLHYKNAQKARSYINMFEQTTTTTTEPSLDNDHIFLNLAHVYAVQQTTSLLANTFRIEYINAKSGIALHYKITVDSDKELKQWVKALRRAIKVHHPEINCLSSSERYNVYDRLKKQNDLFQDQNQNKMFKVVYKELNYRAANNESSSPKELFVPMLLSIGQFSFYLTPLVLKDQVYEKAIQRDRFGLLSIQSIRYEDIDDTIILDIKQIGKPNLQLAFASTFCESIVQHLHRGVQALVPSIAATLYDKRVPSHIRHTRVVHLYIHPDPGDAVTDDEEVQRFHTVLRAYSAAMNLNKLRFQFSIQGPMKAKAFTLLCPNEVNQTPSFYDKFELLAIIKTVQYNNIFTEVSFANQPLDVLEKWQRKENEGWAFSKQHRLKDSNILANEIYNMLTNLDSLSKIDLTNCSIGTHLQESAPVAQNSALAQIGHIMKLGKTNVTRICIGKNVLTENDFNKLVQGIREHKQPIKELRLNECGLEKDMFENMLKTLYEKKPEQLGVLDFSVSPTNHTGGNTAISHLLTEKMVKKFTGLDKLYMRGHNLLDLNYSFLLETSSLSVLDISECKLSTENIQRLCRWIQSRSFDNIKELHLESCHLTGKHATDILTSISQAKNKASTHLNLGNNPLFKNPGYLHQFVAALTQRPGPTSLCLARVKFDDLALREFLEGLCTNQTITQLDLSDVSMTDTDEISAETVRQLTSLFEKNKTLQSLDVHYHHTKAKHLAYSAMQTKSLFGSALVKALQGLQNNTTLSSLNISGMNIQDTGALALCRVLERNKGLQSIIIDENNISIDGYRKLSNTVEDIATQVIHIPHPHIDLRHQLKYLLFRVEELLISENEARFFLIHASGGETTRATRHKLEMIHEEMRTSKLAIKNFTGVLEKLQHVVQKNLRDHERRQQLEMEYRQHYNRTNTSYDDYGWDAQRNAAPTIYRRPTNASLSSGGSSNDSPRASVFHHHKPNEMDSYAVTTTTRPPEHKVPPTPSTENSINRELELELMIEQQRRIFEELEMERDRLRAQHVHRLDQESIIYPPYYHHHDNLSNDDFSYADDFQRSFTGNQSPTSWEYNRPSNAFLPPDTRDE